MRVWESCRTSRNFGYGYGMGVLQQLQQKFRVLWHGRIELTEVSGTGMNILQNLQKFRLRVKTRKIHGLGGGVRFEVVDSIELAWHALTGPTSPRQSVVALRAIDRREIVNLNKCRPWGNSCAHGYYYYCCSVTQISYQLLAYPGCGASNKIMAVTSPIISLAR